MEDVKIPTEPTEQLRAVEQILKRANELKKIEPVVAYWCCFSAAQRALKVPGRTKESTLFIVAILDALEEMKRLLDNNEAITSEAAGSAMVENFALKVFLSADNDDRAGKCDKSTIRKFVVAGQFIEVLKCFESVPLGEEMEQKLQYARWKAADLSKALREGRQPTPGPPVEEALEAASPFPSVSTELPSIPSTTPASPPARPTVISPRPTPLRPQPDLPALNTLDVHRTPPRQNSMNSSGAWSTLATPGLPDDDGESRLTYDPVGTPPTVTTPKLGEAEKKNVRFMGPDGAPLSPAQTMVSVETFDEPIAPPPTIASSSPKQPSAPLPPPAPAVIRPRSNSASFGSGAQTNGIATVPAAHVRPSPPAVVSPPLAAAPRPPVTTQPHGLGLTSPAVATLAPAPTPTKLSRKEIDQTQKHARWAISALDYDDYETARAELRKALAMLGG
ncbi:hypothetical protein Q5752_004275 [Cryptotrichosporon argae]